MKRHQRFLFLHPFSDRFEHEAVWRYVLLLGQLVNAFFDSSGTLSETAITIPASQMRYSNKY
jgi:hypothetical protein